MLKIHNLYSRFSSTQDAEAAPTTDDDQVRVSWRGDGQYFAISSRHPRTKSRVLRTWSRDGVHHSTSETANGLEHVMDWK